MYKLIASMETLRYSEKMTDQMVRFMYEFLINKKRLHVFRKCHGDDAADLLINAINNCLLLQNSREYEIIKLFNLIESESNFTMKQPPYSIGDRKLFVLNNDKNLAQALADIKKELIIGFDTEQKPKFKKTEKTNKIAILQIATAHSCYIFQINQIKNLRPILEILENESIVKVGFGLKNDLDELKKNFSINLNSIIDFQDIFKKLYIDNPVGAKKAVHIFLQKDMKKSRQAVLSNWESKTLTQSQLKYASEDATAPIDTFNRFLSDYPKLIHIMPAWFREKFKNGIA